ncbi:shufflon system plasmid conjugative transfer pilus tip adhesin PilV [Pseudoduganella namucuonensis]|uniref:Shufflon protein, N-terminal constant region n=1 Tax=Pseudoduganella namucuonensis TaxID=1035707 RepID=A0A1I7L7W5_9BURK|nr:shufflon system plasmid conjugative transfer pilus tip adhesin PilV [Pseudoduganella namucuonensis]SFV05811.1 shufflon protein, N-terminal constant region [Pseudoduganella namucuonensis]
MIFKRTQRGLTLIETLGALALASILLVGFSSAVAAWLDDAKGQQTSLHQAQVAVAASKYIAAKHAELLLNTTGGAAAAISAAQLQADGFLPEGFSGTNAFGQAACVLVLQTVPGKLDALVATHGGTAIPERDLPQMAMQAGQGGGYISAAAPGLARGASWALPTTSYRDIACGAGAPVLTGAASDGGHLVSNLLHDGPGQLPQDFLSREAVPGRPEANRMNTPLHLAPGTGAQAVEDDAADPRCTAAGGDGKVAVDASGRMLSCQAGVWRRQGSGFWRDPVPSHASLPASGNQAGETRMVTGLNRAFTWSGAAWEALAVDRNGDFLVPETLRANFIRVSRTVVKNTACAPDGAIASDATGLALSCQSGQWRNPLEFRLSALVYDQEWTAHVGDGTVVDTYIDLTALPGPRPLYLTGYAFCHATGYPRAYAYVNMLDAANNGYIAGGCMSRPDNGGAGVLNKGSFGLQEIPENVTRLRLHREVEVGAGPTDYINIAIKIYTSE